MASYRDFDWDEAKALGNITKHGVPFPYATRVFLDAARIDLDASRPEDGKNRRKAIGMIDGRVFTLVYTEREGSFGSFRLAGAMARKKSDMVRFKLDPDHLPVLTSAIANRIW